MSAGHVLPLAFAMGLIAGAASAHDPSTTLSESMAAGRMSQPAAEQFVAHTGHDVDEAQEMTINEIAFIRWGDD